MIIDSATCGVFLYAEISRVGTVSRETKETSVEVSIDLDGTGICDCDTGIPFLDHMLDVSIKFVSRKISSVRNIVTTPSHCLPLHSWSYYVY